MNELDNRRLEIIKYMPFDKFFNENAEQFGNILGSEIEPSAITRLQQKACCEFMYFVLCFI